jgi:hypothetical protein
MNPRIRKELHLAFRVVKSPAGIVAMMLVVLIIICWTIK